MTQILNTDEAITRRSKHPRPSHPKSPLPCGAPHSSAASSHPTGRGPADHQGLPVRAEPRLLQGGRGEGTRL